MFALSLVTEWKRNSILGSGLSWLTSIPWKEGGDKFYPATNTEMSSIMCPGFSWLRSPWKEREWQGVKENYPTLAEMYIVQYPMFLKREREVRCVVIHLMLPEVESGKLYVIQICRIWSDGHMAIGPYAKQIGASGVSLWEILLVYPLEMNTKNQCLSVVYGSITLNFFVASGHPFAPVIWPPKRNSKKVFF